MSTPPTDLRGLEGRLVAADPVVVPDWFCKWENELLVIRVIGSLLVVLPEDAAEPLRVRLVPAPGSVGRRVLARWGNQPLAEGPLSLPAEGLELVVPETSLAAGRHRLWLEAPPAPSGRRLPVELADVSYAFAGGAPVPVAWRPVLGRFVEFGLAPIDRVWRVGGCLMAGPGTAVHAFVAEAPGRASFRLVNSSPEPARFVATLDGERHEVEVGARGNQVMSFPVAEGRHRLRLEVEGAALGSFFWGLPWIHRDEVADATPVVLITLDTTRRDVVAPHAPAGRTPRLAELAAHATSYDHAWAASPWTLPSHASIFTGLYPSHHGAGVVVDQLPESVVTLAERFHERGYFTVGLAGGMMASSKFGLGQGFQAFRDPPGAESPASVLTDDALLAMSLYEGAPLFLFVNYFDAHAPYAAAPEFEERTGVAAARQGLAGLPEVWGRLADRDPEALATISTGQAGAPPAGVAYLRATYEAEVEASDHHMGRLLDELKARDLYDRALIVVVADHGELFGERGRYQHSYYLDPGVMEVPLLIKWPGQRTPARVSEPVSHVDLFGTILTAAGLAPEVRDGAVLGGADAWSLGSPRTLWMEEHSARFHQLVESRRVAEHLFARQWRDRREIFWDGGLECAEGAPGAWREVPCDGGFAARLAELPAAMRAAARLEADFSAEDLDPEEAERLRALGYLE